MEFVIWLVVASIMFLGVAFVSYNDAQKREVRKAAWRKLAQSQGLKFVAGAFGAGTHVSGSYQGYELRLESFKKNQIFTRLTLSAKPEHQQKRLNFENTTTMPTSYAEANDLLQKLTQELVLRGKVTTEPNFTRLYYEQRGLETDATYLKKLFAYMVQLTDLYQVAALGTEMLTPLQKIATVKDHKLQNLAKQLIYDIGSQSNQRFSYAPQQAICPYCLTRYYEHKLRLSWREYVSYYACRSCRQSRDFLNINQPIVATLDQAMQDDYVYQQGGLRINWLNRRELFDFDSVEIKQASDEDIERFAVQVGNDTDPTRCRRYKSMPLMINSGCELSKNSQRILGRTFKL